MKKLTKKQFRTIVVLLGGILVIISMYFFYNLMDDEYVKTKERIKDDIIIKQGVIINKYEDSEPDGDVYVHAYNVVISVDGKTYKHETNSSNYEKQKMGDTIECYCYNDMCYSSELDLLSENSKGEDIYLFLFIIPWCCYGCYVLMYLPLSYLSSKLKKTNQ